MFIATGVEIEGQTATPMAPHNPYGSSGAMGVSALSSFSVRRHTHIFCHPFAIAS